MLFIFLQPLCFNVTYELNFHFPPILKIFTLFCEVFHVRMAIPTLLVAET